LLVAIPVVGYFAWWRKEEQTSFHITKEGWFGQETYAGGADKSSHFFFSYVVSHELTEAYEALGHSPGTARLLGGGVTVAAGLLTELGDGLTKFGFAWEDLSADIVGAGAAATISRHGWDDVFGLRMGYVKAQIPEVGDRTDGYGFDYSREIYSADVKLAGILKIRPTIGRFLLVSLTYDSKGYRFSHVELRQRNVGVDLGLNIPEILSASGVPESTWWGKVLYKFFTYYRLAYTAFGFRYDLNHGRWHGPDTGDQFVAGTVTH